MRHPLAASFDPGAFVNAIPGGSEFLTYARNEVANSARAAVKPYIIGAYAVAGGAALLSVMALIVSIARR